MNCKIHEIKKSCDNNVRDPHLSNLLCVQFGNKAANIQIVVDCTTIDIRLYKGVLENGKLIGHNLKFDLQFLYNYGIIPRNIYDTMIVEQLLYLGYPPKGKYGGIGYSLADVAKRRLSTYIDKSVRGEIIWRGLDEKTIIYAANDVVYLEDIMWSQYEDLKDKQCLVGAKLECDFVPAIAYLEWCGIKLDADKWKAKMVSDQNNLKLALKKLNTYCLNHPKLQKFKKVNNQLSLFEDVSLEPYFAIDWQKNEAKEVFKILGFNLKTVSKTTGEETESLLEKVLSTQKGIDDKLLDLYFKYQECYKVITSFGQGHLNSINPVTGRLHTNFKQLGASSSRMSCGGGHNEDLAKFKGLKPSDCPFVNLQQLPHDEVTRSCFVAPEDYNFISCDYSAQEGRVQGDIYQDEAILQMYREGIDGHSMYAKIFFKDELKNVNVHDVKKLRPDLRTKAKSPEFALAYGGGYTTIMAQLKCSEEEAKTIVKNYEEGFKGTIDFARKGSAFVRENGYIIINKNTGHRLNWWDWQEWKERQKSFTPEFWEEYRIIKEQWQKSGPHDFWEPKPDILTKVSDHFKTASKYDRLARNAPAQGTSACMTKEATTAIFNWIVDNGYFGIIHCCALVHDETNWDYPKDVTEFPSVVQKAMEQAAAKYCKSLPIPAEASVGSCWIH